MPKEKNRSEKFGGMGMLNCTARLELRLCSRFKKNVTIEKHYKELPGSDVRQPVRIACKDQSTCSEVDCHMQGGQQNYVGEIS